MTNTETPSVPFERVQKPALIIGAAGLALTLLGAFVNQTQFFHSYLVAYLFWLGLTLGSTAWLMVHHLTQGAWTSIIKRLLEGASRTLPYMALAFVPLLFGLADLYQWARPEVVAADPILTFKSAYLNVPFFIARVIGYFVIWYLLVRGLNSITDTYDEATHIKGTRISGVGLLIYALTLTFAAIDWVMSLYPHWASTMHGVFFLVGNGLSTLLFAIICLRLLSDYKPFSDVVHTMHFHDIGKLSFGLTVFWTYINFGQFLIVWSANIAEESPFYLTRNTEGWGAFTILLFVCHFLLPFFILLSRDVKRHKRLLALIATFMLVMRIADMHWHVMPAWKPAFSLHWLDVTTILGLGGIWLYLFLKFVKQKPLIPPYLPEVHDPHGH